MYKAIRKMDGLQPTHNPNFQVGAMIDWNRALADNEVYRSGGAMILNARTPCRLKPGIEK